MPFSNTLRREFQVAFSKNAQPVWLRVVKYLALAVFIYFAWGKPIFWPVIAGFIFLGLAVHFWFRFKTHGWTKAYGSWKPEAPASRSGLRIPGRS